MTPACRVCGARESLRQALAVHLCVDCWWDTFGEAHARHELARHGHGTMLQTGRKRPDFGNAFADCTCTACSYQAVAPVGEPCGPCVASAEQQRAWQAEKVLTPPDIDPDDRNRDGRLKAWAERLARAVAAELITEAQARMVLKREVRHAAA